MEIKGKSIPKFVWLKILGELDGKSLRNSLLVNKEWFKFGSDSSLAHISNRKDIPTLHQFHDCTNLLKYLHLVVNAGIQKSEEVMEKLGEKEIDKLHRYTLYF